MNSSKVIKSTLTVKAEGYWFTAGGAKGSFGFFPHLRDERGMPVYPDTQIHGDLKMAARWLADLQPEYKKNATLLFGVEKGEAEDKLPRPSSVFVGDLKISEESAGKWDESRFEVKTRIQIDETTRTVTDKFLVDLELARLDGLELHAPVFVQLFDENEEEIKKIMDEIAQLLSGFGAFRSRGYGRASSIDFSAWEPLENSTSSSTSRNSAGSAWAFTSLVNVRNKHVDPGNAQVLATRHFLASSQVRAWIARSYHRKFGKWADPGQLSQVRLTSFFPLPDTSTFTLPAPLSALKNKDDEYRDMWGRERSATGHDNFFSTKTKSLAGKYVITDTGKVYPVKVQRRMRNAMDSSFITTDNGLFVQEYMPQGTVFTGICDVAACQEKFAEEVRQILQEEPVIINGALFLASPMSHKTQNPSNGESPSIVVDNIDFNPVSHSPRQQASQQIILSSCRTYNTSLKNSRPRRARIVIMPGSILGKQQTGAMPCDFLGKELTAPPVQDTKPAIRVPARPQPRKVIDLTAEQKKISRSQAGVLRTLLHPALTEAIIKRHQEHRIEKYENKPDMAPLKDLIEELYAVLDDQQNGGLEEFRKTLGKLVEDLSLAHWKPKESNGHATEGGQGQ